MTAIERTNPQSMTLAHVTDYTQDQVELIRATLAPETNDMEFALFMEVARVQGLSPLQRQIHAVMRWSDGKKKMVIQTGIDGYRLIAARTGLHLGTTDATFGPLTADGFPAWAQVTVKKLVHGHVAEYPATAFWEEYVQTTKNGQPNKMWAQRPKGQLSKCAEALALRKAFPAELSGVYTDTEMDQADNPAPPVQVEQHAPQTRRADVTREVQQAAGTPAHTTQPAAQAPNATALQRVRDMAQRVQQYGAERVEEILGRHDWQNDMTAAAAAYSDLKDFGLEQAALLKAKEQAQAAPQEDVQDAQFTPDPSPITNDQIGQLQSAAKGMNADSSEIRAAVWAWILQRPEPVNTTVLTAQDAADVLAYLAKCSPEQRIQATAEAMKTFGIEELPF